MKRSRLEGLSPTRSTCSTEASSDISVSQSSSVSRAAVDSEEHYLLSTATTATTSTTPATTPLTTPATSPTPATEPVFQPQIEDSKQSADLQSQNKLQVSSVNEG